MDQYGDFPTGKSPRRELQGPRPAPLRIHKDSHKIKKPPLAPPPQQPPHQQLQPPPRQPIIIYTVSPKVIHTTPNDFMSLVQRLTGSSSSSSSSISSSNIDNPFAASHGDMVSPAARFAAAEKASLRSPRQPKKVVEVVEVGDDDVIDRPISMFPGILSPGPAGLSPIPASFFSPPSTADPAVVGSFLQDLSPAIQRSFMEGSFVPSPSFFVSPRTPSMDLFNNFFDS